MLSSVKNYIFCEKIVHLVVKKLEVKGALDKYNLI